MKTFQKPLSEEEEIYYLKQLKSESSVEVNEAREILIQRNLRLVAHVVKKYSHVSEESEDLISIGTIGLIKAIKTYDTNKGCRLATYAARCIDNELLMLLRAKKKTARDVSIYEPIGTDKEGNEIHLLDVTLSPTRDFADEYTRREDISKMHQLVNTVLDGREREIIILRYGLGRQRELTQREIGKMLGISRSYVSRIEKKALATLRKAFEDKM